MSFASRASQLAALALSDDSVGLDEFAASEACTAEGSRVAVVLGTEGDGLSRRTIRGRRSGGPHPDGRGSGLSQRGSCSRGRLLGATHASLIELFLGCSAFCGQGV